MAAGVSAAALGVGTTEAKAETRSEDWAKKTDGNRILNRGLLQAIWIMSTPGGRPQGNDRGYIADRTLSR